MQAGATTQGPRPDTNPGQDEGPLTRRQQLIWAEEQLAPDAATNNMGMCFEIEGQVDPERFRAAFRELTKETPLLRCAMDDRGETLVPGRAEPTLEVIDLCESEDPRARFQTLRAVRAAQPLPVTERLVDALLARLGPQTWAFYLCQHHILTDAWSFGLLFQRLASLYETPGAGSPLLPFEEHRKAEREYRLSSYGDEAREFWTRRDQQTLPRASFYGTSARSTTATARRVDRTLDTRLVDALEELGRRDDLRALSPALARPLVYLTALFATLRRVGEEELLGVGFPLLNRPSRRDKRTVGLHMEVCPLRARVTADDTFASLWHKLADDLRQVLPHAPGAGSNPSHDRRYDVMLNIHNARFSEFAGMPVHTRLDNGKLAAAGGERDAWPLDLCDALIVHVHDFDASGRTTLTFELNTGVFPDDRVTDHFVRMLEALVDDPQQPIHDAPMLGDPEREALLARRGPASPDVGGGLLGRFRDWAVRHPDRVAVWLPEGGLTYAQLDREVRSLRDRLHSQGLGPESRVIVYLQRSPRLLVALLAALDAGCAYVPLDPAHPRARAELILADARPSLVLTERSLADKLPQTDAETWILDGDEPLPAPHAPTAAASAPPIDESALAYLLFTSGSTGRPKGVEVERRALHNFLASITRELELSSTDRTLAITTASFDISCFELFAPLWVGGSVILLDDDAARDPARIAHWIEGAEATVLQATPATWQMLVDSGWRGRSDLRAISGGEVLTQELASSLHERVGALYNGYGPTEATVYSTLERVQPARQPPGVGTPIGGTYVRLLGPRGELIPDGVTGELYIGGTGLARGYCGSPELTRERFVPDPYTSHARLYRTGDRARYLKDGRLHVQGRLDDQVKIRGFRVELGDVESVLRRAPGVANAVVVARGEGPTDRHLVGHLTGVGTRPDPHAAAECARTHLPEYMVPTHWVVHDQLPANTNGKVDRACLERLEGAPGGGAASEQRAPANDLEVQIAALWTEVLGQPAPGREENFFDLGGHSLSAVRLRAAMQRELGVQPGLADLFDATTIAAQAKLLEGGVAREARERVVVPLRQGAGEPPLFCVAGVWIYQDFARAMRETLPVYGMYVHQELEWAEALSQGRSPHLPSIECLAARYIEAIREVQPHGPYRLAGLSYGGLLAYEVAQQLTAAGETVHSLLLLDARLRLHMQKKRSRLRRAAHRVRHAVRSGLRRTALRWTRLSDDLLRNLLFFEIAERYERRMRPYPGSALLLRALDDSTDGRGDRRLGWDALVQDLRVEDCAGAHLQIVSGSNAKRLRPVIDRYLDEPSDTPSAEPKDTP